MTSSPSILAMGAFGSVYFLSSGFGSVPPCGVRVRFGSRRTVSGFDSVPAARFPGSVRFPDPRFGLRSRFGAGFGSECATEPGACCQASRHNHMQSSHSGISLRPFQQNRRPHSASKSLRKRDEGPSKGMARVLRGALSLLGSQVRPLFALLCTSSALSHS